MQNKPFNKIYNEWKDWGIISSTTELSKPIKELIRQYLFKLLTNLAVSNCIDHGLRTPNEGIHQRNLKMWADVADKICFGRT